MMQASGINNLSCGYLLYDKFLRRSNLYLGWDMEPPIDVSLHKFSSPPPPPPMTVLHPGKQTGEELISSEVQLETT